MNYKNIFSYLLISGCLFSSSVNIFDAEIVARNLYSAHAGKYTTNKFKIASVEVLKEDSHELIYLFHLNTDGFIMISADDRSTPILAYSFENSFELENVPPNVSWVIERYKKNLLTKIKSNEQASEDVKNNWDKFLYGKNLHRQQNDFVNPLITAEFDQGCHAPKAH